MKNIKIAIIQALSLVGIAVAGALVFNAFHPKGINPFSRPVNVPVSSDGAWAGEEGIRIVSLDEARQLVESGAIVLDARMEEDFEEGHIPGAILFDYYDMATYKDQVLPRLSNDRLIMIYCSEPSCNDSELLAKELFVLGFTRLAIFRGGFEEWSGAGLPVERGAP